jgi:hypothetical protein
MTVTVRGVSHAHPQTLAFYLDTQPFFHSSFLPENVGVNEQ